MSVTFRTRLDTADGPVGIEVPEQIMAHLGPAKRYPVIVTIGDYSYRNSVSWYKGAFRIALSAENLAGAAVAKGDEIDVTLEVDDAPRVLELPENLELTLSDAGLLAQFRTLSYSKQRALVEPWTAAKSDATRDRNLAKILEAASAAPSK